MASFEKDDVLHLAISDEPEAGSVEVSPNITAELKAKGELIGIEILVQAFGRNQKRIQKPECRMMKLNLICCFLRRSIFIIRYSAVRFRTSLRHPQKFQFKTLTASTFIRDSVLDSVQARVLVLAQARTD